MSAAHTVIRASAGAGKTWRLGNRYIGLLAAGVGPENIVAATFSRKAAGRFSSASSRASLLRRSARRRASNSHSTSARRASPARPPRRSCAR